MFTEQGLFLNCHRLGKHIVNIELWNWSVTLILLMYMTRTYTLLTESNPCRIFRELESK